MVKKASEIFEDGPSANPSRPSKPDLRAWGTWLESFLTSIGANSGSVFPTRAALFADLARAANSMAWVIGDEAVAYNGIYRKSGTSGAGAWVRVGDLPYSFISTNNAGAGTANAIKADSAVPVSESALVTLPVVAANTASPVSVSFNGGPNLTIKTASGADIVVGGLVAGMRMLGVVSGGSFRLVSDQASGAIIAAAEAAASGAAGYRDDARIAKQDAAASAEAARLSAKQAGDIAAGSVATALSSAPEKATPADQDRFSFLDSAASLALKYMTWASVKAALKSYFDGLYPPKKDAELTGVPKVPTADAGTNTTQAASTAFVLAAIAANSSPSLGVGQTWQNVLASRSAGTVYQNTSGKPIIVAPQGWARYSYCEGQVSADNSNWFTPPRPEKVVNSDTTYYFAYPMFVVPPGHYYRLTQGNNFLGTQAWLELR